MSYFLLKHENMKEISRSAVEIEEATKRVFLFLFFAVNSFTDTGLINLFKIFPYSYSLIFILPKVVELQ